MSMGITGARWEGRRVIVNPMDTTTEARPAAPGDAPTGAERDDLILRGCAAVADGVRSDELRLCQIPHQVACAIGPVRTVG
jgi:hypothetical protein